jgi:hypothetical protein
MGRRPSGRPTDRAIIAAHRHAQTTLIENAMLAD